jgi:hypothetical protein
MSSGLVRSVETPQVYGVWLNQWGRRCFRIGREVDSGRSGKGALRDVVRVPCFSVVPFLSG